MTNEVLGPNQSASRRFMLKLIFGGIIGLVLVAVVSFGWMVFKYWRDIKAGGGAELETQFYGAKQPLSNPEALARRQAVENPTAATWGKINAPVTIVEFADFKCPFCQASAPVLMRLVQEYPNQVKLMVRHFPLESAHPGTFDYSKLAYCAGQQGKFWPLYQMLYTNQDQYPVTISTDDINNFAKILGIKADLLNQCQVSAVTEATVNNDYAVGFQNGVRSTPTFFVNGFKVAGDIPYETWQQIIAQF